MAQVGDYILSPEMCVERKSLSDLRQSFLSGRLYNQAEAMTKHYKTPILLIEFDRERAFALHSTAELGSDINVSAAHTALLSKHALSACQTPERSCNMQTRAASLHPTREPSTVVNASLAAKYVSACPWEPTPAKGKAGMRGRMIWSCFLGISARSRPCGCSCCCGCAG